MDGKLLLVTNATDLTAQEVVQRHKALADIERGFRVLKSEIEIGPVYHRRGSAPQGTGRHRARLPGAQVRNRDRAGVSPSARAHPGARTDLLHGADPAPCDTGASAIGPYWLVAGAGVGAPHAHPASPHPIAQGDPVTGVSAITAEQAGVFSALGVKKPAALQQLSLL
jgi:hypothetical protein